jgi:hypothetical protein
VTHRIWDHSVVLGIAGCHPRAMLGVFLIGMFTDGAAPCRQHDRDLGRAAGDRGRPQARRHDRERCGASSASTERSRIEHPGLVPGGP